MNSIVYNEDCMAGMKRYKDKHFDLAIVDPPYGIGVDKMTLGNGHNKIYRGVENWDNMPPSKEYFIELIRISQNQILWGANHYIENFSINSSCWIFWDKGTGANDYADGELAWTSFDSTVKKYFKSWVGANAKDEGNRIHPTQKPIALYEWLLHNYANEGDLILDTHLGSGSSRIACHKYGFDFTGFELDKEYFDAQEKRYNDFISQLNIFEKSNIAV